MTAIFGKALSAARGLKASLMDPKSKKRGSDKKRVERAERKKRREARPRKNAPVDQALDEGRNPPPERIATAHLRQLPDFVVIGAQRGGTTSLYYYLSAHPDVGRAFRKEVHFFERHYENGLDWYLAHFPMRGEAPVVGEASPNYLFSSDAPERARGVLPHAKFIALLRNPVDRAYSQYQMNVRRGAERLSFEDALDRENERLSQSEDQASSTWRHYSYLRRGLYEEQLRCWMSHYPREQFLVIRSEDFYEDPGRILSETLGYLGLRPWSPAGFKAYHLSEYADLSPDTRRQLEDYFAPHNQRLYALLGRDLGW